MKYDLHQSPGPLIRRTHQIGLSIFAENFKDLDLTPLQFSIMWILNQQADLDQITLAKSVALDTATCSNIVTRLESKGYLSRKVNPENRRAKLTSLTKKGKQLLSRSEAPMAEVQKKLIAPLNTEEKKLFLKCLQKLVDTNNELSRAPMQYMPLK
ncbi:MAG: MarR family transcriptional regulator [Gammaproteobacteria bacterium]|nr:MarR family transcriptional regulator [Gammaproteobacteria bacterium]